MPQGTTATSLFTATPLVTSVSRLPTAFLDDVERRCVVVLMNRALRSATTESHPTRLGLRHADEYHVRDLWTHTSTVKSGDVQAWVPHAARMFLASPG